MNVSINGENLQPLMIVPMVQRCSMCEKWMNYYIDNYFFSPALFEHWKREISCIVYHNRNSVTQFQAKDLMMMKGCIVSQDPCKSEDHILEGEMRDPYTDNIHDPPAEGNFSVESGNTIKPLVIEVVACMGYVDRCEQMVTICGLNRKTWR
jgi:hypothetical protein